MSANTAEDSRKLASLNPQKRLIRKDSFYTTAIIKPRRKEHKKFELKRVLMDPGFTLNPIPDRLVEKISMFRFSNTPVYVLLAIGEKT